MTVAGARQRQRTGTAAMTKSAAPQSSSRARGSRFYRVEKSRSKIKDKGGTGLGLAIVKHILEAHDSKIKVQSKSGEGSVFSFKLRKDPPRSPIH